MFRNPHYLWWLLPALGAWAALSYWGRRRRRELERALGSPETLARLIAPETAGRRLWSARLEGAALALCLVALAAPQWGVELVETQSRAHNVMIAVDVSESMAAEDLAPSRLERARLELASLLDELRGQRVGIIAFAGQAVTVCPLTADVEAARQLLRTLSPGMIPTPGTAIGDAIREASTVLDRAPAPRALVILSDGEDHKSDPEGAARQAASVGVRILGIGVGTPEGGPIPLRGPGGALEGYKKDKSGRTVVSRLGEKTLQSVAALTGGAYLRAGGGGGAAAPAAEWLLSSASPGSVTRGTAQRYRDRYALPLSLAYLLLLFSLALPPRGPLLAAPWRAARAAQAAAATLLLAFLAAPALAATAEGALRRGNRLYEKGEHEQALESYADSGRRRPKDPRPLFNAGAALYRLNRSEQAAQAFEAAAALSAKDRKTLAAARYNEGNARAQAGDYAGAIAALRRAVTLDPADLDARHNLAVALRRLKNPPPPKPKDSHGRPPDKPDQAKSRSQGAGAPQPKTAETQGRLSREDAERILRAAEEKEKTARQQAELPRPRGRQGRPKKTDEDW